MITRSIALRSQAITDTRAEGVFARMVRLWVEHYQRVADLGIGTE